MPQPEAKILIRNRLDGKVELSFIDAKTGRECRVGQTAGPRQDDIDRAVLAMKLQLERTGSHVSVRTLHPTEG